MWGTISEINMKALSDMKGTEEKAALFCTDTEQCRFNNAVVNETCIEKSGTILYQIKIRYRIVPFYKIVPLFKTGDFNVDAQMPTYVFQDVTSNLDLGLSWTEKMSEDAGQHKKYLRDV